jgi:hypothetical protein
MTLLKKEDIAEFLLFCDQNNLLDLTVAKSWADQEINDNSDVLDWVYELSVANKPRIRNILQGLVAEKNNEVPHLILEFLKSKMLSFDLLDLEKYFQDLAFSGVEFEEFEEGHADWMSTLYSFLDEYNNSEFQNKMSNREAYSFINQTFEKFVKTNYLNQLSWL